MPRTPTQLATPDCQIRNFSSRFGLGIPDPLTAQTAALRANLEHVARRAEPQIFSFSDLGGAKLILHENTPIYIRATHELNPERNHFISDISE